MNRTEIVSGRAFIGEELDFAPVDIVIGNGIITAIEENPRAPDYWICPSLFNAHTHLGDTIAMDCATTGDLESLVTPPHGLKHRLLAEASQSDIVAGIRAGITGMISTGTFGCADFREGGIAGVRQFREAALGLTFDPIVLGREGGEAEADGIGVSSARDVKGLDKIIEDSKRSGKKVAFHAGERDSRDVDAALEYDPDLLIHMTHATRKQLRECAERKIPIVLCPRSNWTLGVTASTKYPPAKEMIDLGCRIYLGTDNAMFVPPDMLSEMAFLSTVSDLDSRQVYRAAVQGSQLAGNPGFIRKGSRAAFFVVDPSRSSIRFSRDPLTTIVKRSCAGLIGKNVF